VISQVVEAHKLHYKHILKSVYVLYTTVNLFLWANSWWWWWLVVGGWWLVTFGREDRSFGTPRHRWQDIRMKV
jgi:hypothetical protein